jgi:UDP-N-acetylmuramate--alanine ligase
MDVYPAREEPDGVTTGATVADAVPLPSGRVRFEPDRVAVPHVLAGFAEPGDVVLTLGAGDVTEIAPLVLAELARPSVVEG